MVSFILGGVVTSLVASLFGFRLSISRDPGSPAKHNSESTETSKSGANQISNGCSHTESTEKQQVKEESPINNYPKRNGTAASKNTRMSYTQADVVAVVGKHNLCCGIFKNPCDKQTHFYKYRYRVKKKPGATNDAVESKEDECPVELRNIAAVIRLWGKHWENISNIKICPYACYVLEDESKWLSRLEGQQEDCQNKYGCRISFQDVEFISNVDRNIFDNLSKRILESSISEDDLTYFNGKDDSNDIDKSYFDL